jgi:hypothetical protein
MSWLQLSCLEEEIGVLIVFTSWPSCSLTYCIPDYEVQCIPYLIQFMLVVVKARYVSTSYSMHEITMETEGK